MPARRAARYLVIMTFASTAWPPVASAGCVWSDLVQMQARMATVKPGAAHVQFVNDEVIEQGCPGAGAACRSRAYVVPGDVVLTGQSQGAYTCAGFRSSNGATTIDWLPTAALALLPAAAQSAVDWAGHWSAPEQDIVIKAGTGGMLVVEGEATWGMGDRARVRNGGVNTGSLHGKVRPVDGLLAFTEGDDLTLAYGEGDEVACRVRMIRRGAYLLVSDNNNCGGLNVSFSGFYVPKRGIVMHTRRHGDGFALDRIASPAKPA